MISIIDFFNINGFQYSASSSPTRTGYEAFRAFHRNESYFFTNRADYYWQVSFSQQVTITSYFISGLSGWSWWPTSWDISYSMDGSSFIYSQTDTVSDLRGNTEIFPMNTPVTCKHFRITGLTVSSGNRALFFNSFDCFSNQSLIKRDRCTCNFNQAKRSQIALILIFFLPSSFTS